MIHLFIAEIPFSLFLLRNNILEHINSAIQEEIWL